jgi:hypothetical protein
MSIRYDSLDEAVRHCMVAELDRDIQGGNLYISSRLTEAGALEWPGLLHEAFHNHDDIWLAEQIRTRDLMRATAQRRTKGGGITIAKVPHNAPETLAEGEFNRYYIRGLCRDVIECGVTEVEIYRGKDASSPRPESQAMIGKRLPADQLLQDLRVSQGVEPALGLPQPNSGLTARRVHE